MPRVDTRQFKSGTVDILTYYVMNGRQYVRKKSSLSRKRVLKSKAFEKTRQCAAKMGIASKIGSLIYKSLPTGYNKERWFYRAITGEAASLLYEGKEERVVIDLLWKRYITETNDEPAEDGYVNQGSTNSHEPAPKTNVKLRQVFFERWLIQGLPYERFKHAWPKKRGFKYYRFRNELNQAVLERKRIR